MPMTRVEQMSQSGGLDGYHNFMGDDSSYKDWYLAPIGQSRDSSCLEQSNFAIGLKMLGGGSDTVMVGHYGHWACGWVEQVYVKPGSKAAEIALKIEKDLADYPVLDEQDYSDRQVESHYSWCEKENHDNCDYGDE